MSEIEKWYTDSADVNRLSGSIDSGGAQTFDRTSVGTVLGHLYSAKSDEQNLLQRYEGRTVKKFLCPLTSDIIFSDILIIDSIEYDVVGVMPRQTGNNNHLEIHILLRE